MGAAVAGGPESAAIAADDAHVIFGTAYDESLGDQLRVTVIATGLSSASRKASITAPLAVVQPQTHAPQQALTQALRAGTDSIPVLVKHRVH